MGLATDAHGIDQRTTPFFDAVRAYRDAKIIPFHTPGHKQGRGAPADWVAGLGRTALSLDVSDVLAAPAWDDSWTAVLAVAEGLAARAFGADFCHFLVNGTTAGVHAMILAAAAGRKLIAARNSHRSVIGGIILADAWPVFVEPVMDPTTGLWLPPPLQAWLRAMDEHPDAAAVLVTYPTYDGAALDLPALAQAAHERGMAVLVDEAHGAHFGLHPDLPPRAMAAGADLSAQSPHKLLSGLTQSSWLLGRSTRISPEATAAVLNVIQTTSPSALLLASLDVARRQAVLDGPQLLDEAISRARTIRRHVETLPGLVCLPSPEVTEAGAEAGAGCRWPAPAAGSLRWDPTKLLIGVGGLGISGFAAARLLRRFGVQVELAGAGYVLALITLGDTGETVTALCQALERLATEGPALGDGSMREAAPGNVSGLPPPGRQLMRPRAAALSPLRLVPLSRAHGLVAADAVCPYPPGIPVLYPGEEVSQEAVEYLQDILRQGGEVRGLAWDSDGPKVRVAAPAGR